MTYQLELCLCRARKLDAARLAGVRNQQHAAAVTKPSQSDSDRQDVSRASPRKPSHDQASRIQNRSNRQTQRMHAHTSQSFETEYNEICSLLAACQSTPGSRQQRRTGVSNIGKPDLQPRGSKTASDRHCLHSHLQSWANVPGTSGGQNKGNAIQKKLRHYDHEEISDPISHGDVIHVLLNRAVHLKHLLASVSSSVQDMNISRPLGCSTAKRHSFSGSPASHKAQDVVDLAGLKALTSSQHSVTCSAKGQDARFSVAKYVADHGIDIHEQSMHLAPCTSSSGFPGDTKGAQLLDAPCVMQQQGLQDDANVTAHLSVSNIHSVVLSGAAELLMSSARKPAFWLTWRMPGSASMRPWLMLTYEQGSVLQKTGFGSTGAQEPGTAAVSEVTKLLLAVLVSIVCSDACFKVDMQDAYI